MLVKLINLLLLIFGIFLTSCSSEVQAINQPASFWYEKLVIAINDGNLEQADSYFNSLQSEHIASPLIGDALILLAYAHMDNNEYLLSGFFINEYKTRYSTQSNVDYILYLQNKANFYAFNNYSKDQGFLDEITQNLSSAISINYNNIYIPYIKHLLTSFKLAKFELDKEIIRIYKMQDKTIAVEKYENYYKELGVDEIEFIPSHIPWYVKIFSW